MSFGDWYDSLPPHIQRYVKTFALHPTEGNKGFVTGYLQAAQDYGQIRRDALHLWFDWSEGIANNLKSAEEYFE